MSVKVLLKSLSNDHALAVGSLLNIKIEKGFVSSQYSDEDEFMRAFHTEGDYIYLPLKFAEILGLHKMTLPKPLLQLSNILKFKGTLLPHQTPIVPRALAHLRKFGTVTLNLSTGFGKTVLGVYLSCELGLPVIVVLPRIHLIKTWVLEFQTFTGVTPYVVDEGPVKGFSIVTVCSIERLSKIPEEQRKGCVLIVDEGHRLATPHNFIELLKGAHPEYMIVCTATMNREEGQYKAMLACTGLNSIITEKMEVKMTVYEYHTGYDPGQLPTNKRGGLDWTTFIKMCNNEPTRTKRLIDRIVEAKGKKILVGVKFKENADNIVKLLRERGEKATVFYESMTGHEDVRVLVAVIAKVSDGYDQKSIVKDFDGHRINMVIIWNSIKSLISLEQLVGRGFRSSMLDVVYCIDDLKTCKSHYAICKKWFKERKATFVKVSETNIPKKVVCSSPLAGAIGVTYEMQQQTSAAIVPPMSDMYDIIPVELPIKYNYQCDMLYVHDLRMNVVAPPRGAIYSPQLKAFIVPKSATSVTQSTTTNQPTVVTQTPSKKE